MYFRNKSNILPLLNPFLAKYIYLLPLLVGKEIGPSNGIRSQRGANAQKDQREQTDLPERGFDVFKTFKFHNFMFFQFLLFQ